MGIRFCCNFHSFSTAISRRFFLLIFLFALLILLTLSCNDNSTNGNDLVLKNPLEMTWTADTIAYPGSMQTLMTSMWASSSMDVWICGHNDQSGGDLWRYNGDKWTYYDLFKDVERSTKTPNRISGFSSSNVWLVGQRDFYDATNLDNRWHSDLIAQYNGTKWTEHKQKSGTRIIHLFCAAPNNVWAVGDSGIVLFYNGSSWKKDYVNVNAPKGSSYFLNGIVVQNNTTYLLTATYDIDRKRYIHYFIKGTIGSWTKVDSMFIEDPSSHIKFGNKGLYLTENGDLYTYGLFGLWKYLGGNWEQQIKIDAGIIGMFSFNRSYRIAVGGFGNVFFYDGNQWIKQEKFYSSQGGLNINDAWTNGKELFLLANTTDSYPMKTVIFKGK